MFTDLKTEIQAGRLSNLPNLANQGLHQEQEAEVPASGLGLSALAHTTSQGQTAAYYLRLISNQGKIPFQAT